MLQKATYPKKKKGFSLIELIVVIGILAVLTVTAVVSYDGLTERAEIAALTADANEVVRMLNLYNALNGDDTTDYGGVAATYKKPPNTHLKALTLKDANDLIGSPDNPVILSVALTPARYNEIFNGSTLIGAYAKQVWNKPWIYYSNGAWALADPLPTKI